jgi:hypothetical protein
VVERELLPVHVAGEAEKSSEYLRIILAEDAMVKVKSYAQDAAARAKYRYVKRKQAFLGLLYAYRRFLRKF